MQRYNRDGSSWPGNVSILFLGLLQAARIGGPFTEASVDSVEFCSTMGEIEFVFCVSHNANNDQHVSRPRTPDAKCFNP